MAPVHNIRIFTVMLEWVVLGAALTDTDASFLAFFAQQSQHWRYIFRNNVIFARHWNDKLDAIHLKNIPRNNLGNVLEKRDMVVANFFIEIDLLSGEFVVPVVDKSIEKIFAREQEIIALPLVAIGTLIGDLGPGEPFGFVVAILGNSLQFAIQKANSVAKFENFLATRSVVTTNDEGSFAASNLKMKLRNISLPIFFGGWPVIASPVGLLIHLGNDFLGCKYFSFALSARFLLFLGFGNARLNEIGVFAGNIFYLNFGIWLVRGIGICRPKNIVLLNDGRASAIEKKNIQKFSMGANGIFENVGVRVLTIHY